MNSGVYLVLKFLVSVLVPLLLRLIEPTATVTEKALLGIGIFLGWSSLDMLHYLRQLDAARRREADLWTLEHDSDILLNNIRRHYRSIIIQSYGEGDLFIDYFQTQFAEMVSMLQTAAEQKQLSVSDFHFHRTELLLGAFAADESAVLRYVWILHKGEALFDNKWEHYCDQILKGTTDGAIKQVRALLVLGDSVSIEDAVIKNMAGFYECAKAHRYKMIDEVTYNHLKEDNRLGATYIDFGIYGRRYIYLTESYGAVTAGKFCKDISVIDQYTKFFDRVWASTAAKTLPKSMITKVKLSEFLKLRW